MHAAYIRGAIKIRRRARMRTPSSVATSLTLQLGAALAYRSVRAAGAAARTRKRPLQAPRRISAALHRPRYRACALLRALNQPQACVGRRPPRRRPSRKTAGRARALPPSWQPARRVNARTSSAAKAREGVGPEVGGPIARCDEPVPPTNDALFDVRGSVAKPLVWSVVAPHFRRDQAVVLEANPKIAALEQASDR